MNPRSPSLLILLATCGTALLRSAETPPTDEQTNFFERKIRPVLAQKCYDCHSATAKKIKGGLKLDTKEATLRGGENGPAVVPGKPEESLLLEAIRYTNKDMEMPPKSRLADSVVQDFETWIKMGAPDPRSGGGGAVADADKAKSKWKKREINIEEGRKYWAFQPPQKHAAPPVKDAAWPKNDIDRFILAKMEEKNLHPVADASKLDLLRRVSFDITGLPPSPELIQRYIKDTSNGAFEKVVDELLASDRFGEHWGRHWLDVARYAESSGKDVNVLYPFAWRYRDWVIDAFNKGMPFNEFLRQQIAGDLLPYKDVADQSKKIVATGFLAIGTKPQNERNPRQFLLEIADEQIDTVSQAMLGVTIACARCHDHKFDPIPQKDYYALAGIFLSSETLYGTNQAIQNARPSDLIDLGSESNLPAGFSAISAGQRSRLAEQKIAIQEQMRETQSEAMAARKSGDKKGSTAVLRIQRERSSLGELESEVNRYDEKGNPRILAMGVYDRKYATDSPIYTRGDATQPQDSVARGLVQVLFQKTPPPINKGSGRLELATWLGSEENPLTARVYVNRVWRWLFGRGIVATPDNFGAMGDKPTHPELLDDLAVKFMEDGWNVKSLVRRIVLSRTYQMGSHHQPQNFTADAENTLHWRANERRLTAEEMRDTLLTVSGKLDLYPKDGSPVVRAPGGIRGYFTYLQSIQNEVSYTRSVYLPVVRDQLPETLALFDFADPSLVVGDRENTNVPSQGLYLLNSPQVQSLADAFGRRVYELGKDDPARITYAYWIAFGRAPTPQEQQATRTFFLNYSQSAAKAKMGKNAKDISIYAWSAFCQALMGSAEFRYVN